MNSVVTTEWLTDTYFVFEISRVQFSAQRLAVMTDFYSFPQSPRNIPGCCFKLGHYFSFHTFRNKHFFPGWRWFGGPYCIRTENNLVSELFKTVHLYCKHEQNSTKKGGKDSSKVIDASRAHVNYKAQPHCDMMCYTAHSTHKARQAVFVWSGIKLDIDPHLCADVCLPQQQFWRYRVAKCDSFLRPKEERGLYS